MEASGPMRMPPGNIPWKIFGAAAGAFLCGVVLSEAAGILMDSRVMSSRLEEARKPLAAAAIPDARNDREKGLEAFVARNLFGLDGEPSGISAAASGPAGVSLFGTFPPVGALFRVGGNPRAVLVGQRVGSEILRKVEGTRVSLFGGTGTRTLDILYAGAGSGAPAPAQPAPARTENRQEGDARKDITPPSGGQEGLIERDAINKLLMDPYQELNRVRLRPKLAEDGAPQGIEAQWLHRDSLLRAMGVRSGDVIHALNDIPIRTTSDIVNAMNSLLKSDRFVVSFFRDGADSQVAYTVR